MRKLLRFIPAAFVMIMSFGAHAVTCYNGVYCSNISTSTTGTPVTSIPSGSTGNKVFTAKWTPKVYTVTLDNQGATSAGTTAYYYQYNTASPCYYYTSSTSFTQSTCLGSNGYTITKPTRIGYTFGGYYTGKNGTGTQYVDANGSGVNNLYAAVAGNTTLYAKWTPNTFNVTIVANGGTPDGSVPTKCTYGTPCVLPTYTKAGYKFDGWKCS